MAPGDSLAALRRRAAVLHDRRPQDEADGPRKAPIYQSVAVSHGGNPTGTVERLLASYGVPPPTAGNRVELVTSGVDAYLRIIRLIEQARSTIHITTYILGSDEGSQALICLPDSPRGRGRDGALLLDDVGSLACCDAGLLAPLIEAGAEVAYFMPMIHIPFRGRANLQEPSQADHCRRPNRPDGRHEPCVALYRAARLSGSVARSVDGRGRTGGFGDGSGFRVGLAIHDRPRSGSRPMRPVTSPARRAWNRAWSRWCPAVPTSPATRFMNRSWH